MMIISFFQLNDHFLYFNKDQIINGSWTVNKKCILGKSDFIELIEKKYEKKNERSSLLFPWMQNDRPTKNTTSLGFNVIVPVSGALRIENLGS